MCPKMRVCFAGAVQSQWRAEQALLKEFLQAQEAAHLAELEARRTTDALKMQEELLAVETDRRAVEEEKQRIEEEKRRALADIEKRTQLALVALEVRSLVVCFDRAGFGRVHAPTATCTSSLHPLSRARPVSVSATTGGA